MRWIFAALACLWLPAVPATAAISVRDDSGRIVRIDEPARRIVSLAPHATEMLFDIGAGDRVVATVKHSDFPDAAQDLPRVGGYDRLNIERILSLQPDLVIGWQSGNPPGQLERLRQLGLTLFISEPRALKDIAGSLERIGHLAGTDSQARAAANAYRQRLHQLRARYAGRSRVDVFYEVWNDPLMTVNGEHLISDVIRGCGGHNVFAELPAIAPRISTEAVLARDPDVIVASGMGQQRPEWLDQWKQWPELNAVNNDDLYFIPPQLLQRHTPRILDGMQRLCEQLQRVRS